MQRTQYYPSGLPWAEGEGTGVQNKKYNGKEWIEMHGLDEFDYGARGMFPAIGRFTTVDPLAEKYYSISPYAYCAGNPVRFVDPNGKASEESSGRIATIPVYNPKTKKFEGKFTSAQSSIYSPTKPNYKPIKLTERQLMKIAILKAKQLPQETVTTTKTETQKFMEARSDFDKQMTESPVIKAVATGALVTAAIVAVPATVTTVEEVGTPLMYKTTQTALSNPNTTLNVLGVGYGLVYSLVTEEAQDLPQLNTGLPAFDNASQITQTGMTFMEWYKQYIASTSLTSNSTPQNNTENEKK